jgi:hypothetical protein
MSQKNPLKRVFLKEELIGLFVTPVLLIGIPRKISKQGYQYAGSNHCKNSVEHRVAP